MIMDKKPLWEGKGVKSYYFKYDLYMSFMGLITFGMFILILKHPNTDLLTKCVAGFILGCYSLHEIIGKYITREIYVRLAHYEIYEDEIRIILKLGNMRYVRSFKIKDIYNFRLSQYDSGIGSVHFGQAETRLWDRNEGKYAAHKPVMEVRTFGLFRRVNEDNSGILFAIQDAEKVCLLLEKLQGSCSQAENENVEECSFEHTKTEINLSKKVGFLQGLATVLAGVSLAATVIEGLYYDDFYYLLIGGMICVAVTIGSSCLTGYFYTSKESLFRYANMSILTAYAIRIIDVVAYCTFAEKAPVYMMFISGLPAAIALLSEILILKNGLENSDSKENTSKGKGVLKVVLILQFVILAYMSFLSISDLMEGISSASLSSLYYITLFVTNFSLWRIVI